MVVLVIVLGGIPRGEGLDLGHDRVVEAPTRLQRCSRGFRHPLLLFIVKEDRRSILTAAVHKLSLRIRGIDLTPEDIEQGVVAHHVRVVVHLDRLGVAGCSAANLLVGGELDLTVRVARDHRGDAGQLFEGQLHAPETPPRKGRHPFERLAAGQGSSGARTLRSLGEFRRCGITGVAADGEGKEQEREERLVHCFKWRERQEAPPMEHRWACDETEMESPQGTTDSTLDRPGPPR